MAGEPGAPGGMPAVNQLVEPTTGGGQAVGPAQPVEPPPAQVEILIECFRTRFAIMYQRCGSSGCHGRPNADLDNSFYKLLAPPRVPQMSKSSKAFRSSSKNASSTIANQKRAPSLRTMHGKPAILDLF